MEGIHCRVFQYLFLLLAVASSKQSGAQVTPVPSDQGIDILIAYPEQPENALIVVEATKPVTLARGVAYDLACHFQPEVSSDWTVSWRKTGSAVAVSNSSKTFLTGWLGTVFEDYQIRFQNFSSEDAGYYYCQAAGPDGVTRQVSAILQVLPEITVTGIEDGRTSAFVQQSKELGCSASGFPPPTVTWRRNGVEVADSGSLVFTSLDQNHNGTYECVAQNNAGTVTERADIVVAERMKWTVSPALRVTAVRGQPLTVTCEATGLPTPYVEWGKFTSTYRRLPHLDNQTTVTLSAAEYKDGDSFVCIARSTFPCCMLVNTQTPLVARFAVAVSDTAPPTQAGSTAGVDCRLTGAGCSAASGLHATRSTVCLAAAFALQLALLVAGLR